MPNLVESDDINECALGTHNCDIHAICTNTIANYTCKCKTGYSGNGFTCYGNIFFWNFKWPRFDCKIIIINR